MASEELQQKYPDGIGFHADRFEVFETQLTTLNQFAKHNIIPSFNFGRHKARKWDALVIERSPTHRVVAIGETKAPGDLNDSNWMPLAEDLLTAKMSPTKAMLGYITDGIFTKWITGGAGGLREIQRQDAKALPTVINFTDAKFLTEFRYIVDNLDQATGVVMEPKKANPEALAKEVWQTVWRLQADRPEDCLATFVEIFIFKFLDDLKLMTTSATGANVSFSHVLGREKEKSFAYYEANVRPHIRALFPEGPDGLSIINGIVLQPSNRDHNIIFHEILKKFQAFGSLRDTSPEFKSRLYESFLQESKTTSSFGQHFTPRKVVAAIHDMADISNQTAGKEICDPAAGVGGFVLEQMARNLDAQWTCSGNDMAPVHNWHALEIVPKTAILAKANALVHCGDLLASQPARIPAFAAWLNNVFACKGQTSFGSLEDRTHNKYDYIITNPPFVVSGSADIAKLIKENNARKTYFSQKSSGLEGLFVQFIVKALKKNGHAWVLLPETFFLRSTDRQLRDWMFESCHIDLMAALPERTFFNTPKRVVIVHLRKRLTALTPKGAAESLKEEKILLYAVSEIGETRDAKRFPERSDLPELVKSYKLHSVGAAINNVERAVVVSASSLYKLDSINIRHHWPSDVARRLGLLGSEEDPLQTKRDIESTMKMAEGLIEKWKTQGAKLAPPPTPTKTVKLQLADFGSNGKPKATQPYFTLKIGKRVLKRDVHNVKSGVKLFSANVRKPFGFVSNANAGGLQYGGALWSIDSDFDCRGVSPGETYSITDHCGQITLLVPDIDPAYLAAQVRQAGLDYGFNREFRPSLELIRKLEIELPVDDHGNFDLKLMQDWTSFREKMELFKNELSIL
jgi:hypothetical protein